MPQILSRRDFLATTTAAAGALVLPRTLLASSDPIFEISIAQWSLNPLFFNGDLDNLDYAKTARALGIDAIEYVNQFFMDKAEDQAYLREMKLRADGEGVRSVLIMCDREGELGDPDAAKRTQAVENHYKWVEAAKFLGCHSIRVNGYSQGSYTEQLNLVADGFRRLCEFADPYDIDVIIENHGGYSSSGAWVVELMQAVEHPRVGTLPDFGNFRMREGESYDSYRGVAEMMPYATGVSVKTTVWDDDANTSPLDYDRMMRIVLDAGYRGYCGIEHTDRGRELEAVAEVRTALLECRDRLRAEYTNG